MKTANIHNSHRTTSRVLDALELIAASSGGCALRDVSQALNAPKSSLLPLLRTLVDRGYISQDTNGHYQLGTKVLELSGRLDQEHDLRDIAHPELVALRNATDESTILVRLTSDRESVVYIDKVEGSHRIRAAAKIGETRCLHSTSSGKLLLAHMPLAERNATVKNMKLTRFTKKTIVKKSDLLKDLDDIVLKGYCTNVDQSVLGHSAIAAPIRNHCGEVIAACVLSAPTDRVQHCLTKLTEALLDTADTISAKMGFHQSSTEQPRRAALRS